jgi:hypothetical protein
MYLSTSVECQMPYTLLDQIFCLPFRVETDAHNSILHVVWVMLRVDLPFAGSFAFFEELYM